MPTSSEPRRQVNPADMDKKIQWSKAAASPEESYQKLVNNTQAGIRAAAAQLKAQGRL